MRFGLPVTVSLKVPNGYTAFTVGGRGFAYPEDKKTINQRLMVIVTDIAGNPSWNFADDEMIAQAVIEHLNDERRSNSDGHM